MIKITKKDGEEKVTFKSGVVEIVDANKIKKIISPDGNEVRNLAVHSIYLNHNFTIANIIAG